MAHTDNSKTPTIDQDIKLEDIHIPMEIHLQRLYEELDNILEDDDAGNDDVRDVAVSVRDALESMIGDLRADDERLEGYEINKILVLNTAHISENTAKFIEDEDIATFSGEYGYVIYADRSGLEDEDAPWPADLVRLCGKAHELGCTHLRLDSDGPVVKDLETFNW